MSGLNPDTLQTNSKLGVKKQLPRANLKSIAILSAPTTPKRVTKIVEEKELFGHSKFIPA